MKTNVIRWLIISVLMSGTAWAQEPDKQMVSPKLAVAGVLTTAVGLSVLLHWNEDDVHAFGNSYCVGNNGDVDYGRCGSATETKVGLALTGAGVLMAWLGMRSKTVKVAPQVSKASVGAVVQVQWGGARAQQR